MELKEIKNYEQRYQDLYTEILRQTAARQEEVFGENVWGIPIALCYFYVEN